MARILALNASYFLKAGGHFVISIKANCIDSTVPAEAVFESEVKKMVQEQLKPSEQVTLEPFERDHACVVGGYHLILSFSMNLMRNMTLSLVFLLILLVGAAAGILYLVFQPKLPKNTTVLDVVLSGQTDDANTLITSLQQQQQQTGIIPLNLRVIQPVRIKLGEFKLMKVKFRVRCRLDVDNLAANNAINIRSSSCKFRNGIIPEQSQRTPNVSAGIKFCTRAVCR
ncbi:hypothetical protein OIU85_002932 [Salix viminalis]|uniref:Uncharacterized protein n=1 Tax=Salix viminalis TaxID=40686 RepID=A0A9Q0VPX9_SALVM|nr:hypothetical protein OIU85_002932 [Salix viminalis]